MLRPRIDDHVFQQHETSLAESGRGASLDVPAPVGRADLARLQDALADGPVPMVSRRSPLPGKDVHTIYCCIREEGGGSNGFVVIRLSSNLCIPHYVH